MYAGVQGDREYDLETLKAKCFKELKKKTLIYAVYKNLQRF